MKRQPLVFLCSATFPYLENISTCQINWAEMDDVSKQLCLLLLRCFQAAIFIQYDEYFSLEKFQIWMFFLKRILDLKIPPGLLNKPDSWHKVLEMESQLDWKLKRLSSTVISRTLYFMKLSKRRIEPHVKLIKEEFLGKYVLGFLESCFSFLKIGLEIFISPKFAQSCLRFLFYAFQVDSIAKSYIHIFDSILFDLCTPMLAMNQKDQENWLSEPAAFLYAQDCKLDGHNCVKEASKDLIDMLLKYDDTTGTPFIRCVIGFVRGCFEQGKNLRTGQVLTPQFEECLIALLIHIHKKLENDHENWLFEVEQVIEHHLIKQLFSEHEVIRARVCNLLNVYGVTSMVKEESLSLLCKGLEAALSSSHLVAQTSAVLALNRCTSNDKIAHYFSMLLPSLIDLIFKCMNSVDYKELVYAAEGLIKDFGDRMLPYSQKLLEHFKICFYQYLQHSKIDQDATDDEDEEIDDESEVEANVIYESVFAAEACLECILSILQLNLPPNLREETNNLVLVIVCDILLEVNQDLLQKAVGLLNFVLYGQTCINDATKFFFPILLYILNEKPQGHFSQAASILPENFLKVLTEIDFRSLNEGMVTKSLGCILNYISKLGPNLYTSVDYYGIPFIDLLINMMMKVIKEALTGPSDVEIIFMLRIVVGILEESKEKYPIQRLDSLIDMTLSLCKCSRSEALNLNILQTLSMLIWHSPVYTVNYLKHHNQLKGYLDALCGKLKSLDDEKSLEQVEYGLIAFLEMTPTDFAASVHS